MIKKVIAFILFIVSAACSQHKAFPSEGFIQVKGGRIWYKIIGSGNKTPLVLLHGGPGFPSSYLKPLEALADERPVIFYDQLGSGRSDKPEDPALWTIRRFADELETLRKELDLGNIHLYGHSWGTMLAMEYMAGNPGEIKSLILASPAISVDKWLSDANTLKELLPRAVQDTLIANERRGSLASESYRNATAEFYKRHVCRIDYTPEVQETFDNINMDVYGTMWGNNEFTCTGNLRGFDRSATLKKINIPILFTCGEYDEATPATTKWYADQVTNASFKVIKGASHFTMNEKPGEYVKILREFLNTND